MTSDGLRYFSTAELALTMAMLRTWLCCCLVAALALSETGAEWKKCKDDLNSGGCLALSEHSLDLSPLTGYADYVANGFLVRTAFCWCSQSHVASAMAGGGGR